jgi:hypothetical protein
MTRRRSLRWAVTFAVLCTAVMLIAPAAQGDLFHDGQFVFGATIKEGDPVNLLWAGGHDNLGNLQPKYFWECEDSYYKSARCVRLHNAVQWRRGGMDERGCNGSQDSGMWFHLEGGGHDWSNEDIEVSSARDCNIQFHERIWSDSHHGHTQHGWAVTPIHHEHCRHPYHIPCGHKIDKGWETVEHIAIHQYGADKGGQIDRCTYYDWHRRPGSAGMFKRFHSDGRVSRISFTNTGHGCSGA